MHIFVILSFLMARWITGKTETGREKKKKKKKLLPAHPTKHHLVDLVKI